MSENKEELPNFHRIMVDDQMVLGELIDDGSFIVGFYIVVEGQVISKATTIRILAQQIFEIAVMKMFLGMHENKGATMKIMAADMYLN